MKNKCSHFRISDYPHSERVGLKFETDRIRRAFVRACATPSSVLYGTPRDYPGRNIVIVPREIVGFVKEQGFVFQEIKIVHPDDISREEYIRFRSEQGFI